MFLVAANTRQAIVGQKEWLTTGSSGIQVQFLFSEDWNGLSKFAVFRNAEIEESVIPIALPSSNLTELPAENCAAEYVDEKVYVGMYGTDGLGHIIIPTIWVSLGVLKEGAAYEGMDPPQPTPDMWAQILAIAQNAGAENAEAAEKAEAGAKEAASTAQAAAAEVKNLSVDADTLAAGEPATVEKTVDAGTGAVKLKFGIPQGPKGDQLTYEDLTEEQKAELVQGPIREAQTSAVAAVGSARTTAVNAVNQAGTTQTGAVNRAGANQVAAVNQAGETQVQAVEDKGAEVLDSIPQDYSDLVDDVADLSRQLNDETTGLDTKAPVILETASGAIASFDDGADSMPIKSLVATIEPVQDLHGYEYPWPGGGGKNKFENTATSLTSNGVTLTVNSDGTVTCSGTATGTAVLNMVDPNGINQLTDSLILSGCPAGGDIDNTYGLVATTNDGARLYADSGAGVTMVNYAIFAKLQVVIRSGVNANGLVFKPMIRLATETDATFEPYSNICPISGWTGLNGVVAGKNFVDGFSFVNGYYDADGTVKASEATKLEVEYIPCNPLKTYYVETDPIASNVRIRVHEYDANKNWLRQKRSTVMDAGHALVTWESSEGAAYFRFSVPNFSSGVFCGDYSERQTFPLTFTDPTTGDPMTIYGGTVTLNEDGSADVVNTKGNIASYAGETLPGAWISSMDVYAEGATPTTGAQVVYELAAPVTYHFSDVGQLKTFLGTNNIWVDTGDVTVTAPRDTKMYVDNKIAEAVAAALNA